MEYTKFNYKRNIRYFEDSSHTVPIIFGIIPSLLGFLLIIIYNKMNENSIVGILGILSFLWGPSFLYAYFKRIPTYKEIDNIFKTEVSNAREYALKKIGLDKDQVKLIKPKTIHGPYLSDISNPHIIKKGKDGSNRSSNYEIVVMYFCKNALYSYKYRFSIIYNDSEETTDEYFYKDIVSISTASKNSKKSHIKFEEFKLSNSGANSISCSLLDNNKNEFEKTIQGMKSLIRERKNSHSSVS